MNLVARSYQEKKKGDGAIIVKVRIEHFLHTYIGVSFHFDEQRSNIQYSTVQYTHYVILYVLQ